MPAATKEVHAVMNQMKSKTALALIALSLAVGLAACGGSSVSKDSGILPCATVDDCPDGWACQDGLCMESVPECVFDVDCDQGEQCVDGTCQQIQSDGGTDGGDGDGGGDVDQDTPAIEVDPSFIDFGNGRIGDTVIQELTLSNTGSADLTVFSLTMESGTSDEFSAEPLGNLNQVLIPAGQLTVTVRYRPVDGSADAGALLIACDDPDNALVRVELTSSYKGTSELTVADDPAGDLTEVELIDFGQVQVGTPTAVTVYVLNTGTGNAVLTVDEVRTQPVSSEYFQLDVNPAPPAYLNPYAGACSQDEDCGEGNTCASGVCLDATGAVIDAVAVEVTFTPTQVGSFQESLVINNDEGDGSGDETIRILTLRGEGIQPALSVSPNPIDFGHWYVGQASNLTISLHNDGGQALTIDTIGLEDGSGPFALDAGGPGPWLLGPGQQLQLSADYTPEAPGSHADVLRIDSNDPDSPTRVDVYGSASQPPAIAVDPAALDFGQVQLGQVVQLAFQVRNDGGSPLLIDSLGLLGGAGEFSLLQAALPAIAPGGSAQVDVTYAPVGAIGADADLVRLTSNDPITPEVLLDLSGIGTDPVLELSPGTIDFGPIYQGFTAGPQLLTVRNSGFGNLRINAIGLAAGSNPDYALQNLPVLPADLGPGQSLPVEIFFTPSGSGVRTAAVQVGGSDVDLPLASVQVSGSGTDCPEGFWDIDGDPGNGCEYPCDLSNGGVEDCDGLDNDCDESTDENLTTRACQQANQFGTCTGSETCDGLNGWVGCDAAMPEQEVCDGDDNDCDGAIDSDDPGLVVTLCELQAGVCAGSRHHPSQCNGSGWAPCTSADYEAHDPVFGVEVCGNGQDEDCSGAANDKDVDADGAFDDACAGGTDCDDANPDSYPGAPEIQDAADNDCDNLVDEGLIPAGAVIVTEIMKNPDGVLDSVGEYFEVTNDWVNPVNLHSWTVSDNGTNIFTVIKQEGIVIGPGESAVFCINSDSLLNGGVSCDFDFDNFQLGNGDDEIVLSLDGVEIDRVEYDTGATFPDPTGESLSLDPAAYDASDNDDGANWCATPLDAAYELESGDHGTPGQFNPSCSGALALLDVVPDSGIEFGGETITLIGAGFTGLNTVTVGGVACASFTVLSDAEATCITPALAAGDHDVTVAKGPNFETLVAGYRTIGEDAAPGIGWCVIQWPSSTTTSEGVPTELVFGRVYQAGVTEPAGPPAGINADIGFGPAGSDPRTTPGWVWQPGVWNPSCPDCANDDEFMQSIITEVAGSYSFAVRFSEDGGYRFTFCDLPPGTTDGFSADALGALTVSP